METVTKSRTKTIRRKKVAEKPNNSLAAIFGMLKGKIFYDDAIFNLGVRP